VEKPLVVMTPKSLLRHPRCVSPLQLLAEGRFEEVLDDPAVDPARVRRVVVATGKLYYDLLKGRDDRRADGEQLYPFPAAELGRALGRYPSSAEVVWAQEEPHNMGAWRFVWEQFLDGAVPGVSRPPRYIGREPSASPAPGSHKAHLREQEAIVAAALTGGADAATPEAVVRGAAPATS
jgi:2-oxoglutarate dehydrogenase E1 component